MMNTKKYCALKNAYCDNLFYNRLVSLPKDRTLCFKCTLVGDKNATNAEMFKELQKTFETKKEGEV